MILYKSNTLRIAVDVAWMLSRWLLCLQTAASHLRHARIWLTLWHYQNYVFVLFIDVCMISSQWNSVCLLDKHTSALVLQIIEACKRYMSCLQARFLKAWAGMFDRHESRPGIMKNSRLGFITKKILLKSGLAQQKIPFKDRQLKEFQQQDTQTEAKHVTWQTNFDQSHGQLHLFISFHIPFMRGRGILGYGCKQRFTFIVVGTRFTSICQSHIVLMMQKQELSKWWQTALSVSQLHLMLSGCSSRICMRRFLLACQP